MNGLESLAEREAKFHELRQDYRRQLHKLQGAVDQYKLSELERGMDVLIHQAAELAREPLMRHLLALAAVKPLPFSEPSMVELGRETQAREWDAYAAKQAEAYFDEREKRLAAEAALAKAVADHEATAATLHAYMKRDTPKEPNNG